VPVDRHVVHLHPDTGRAHPLVHHTPATVRDADRVEVPHRVDARPSAQQVQTVDPVEQTVVALHDVGSALLQPVEPG